MRANWEFVSQDSGGMRIEDMLIVTADGAEVLTQTPKPATLLEL